MNEKIEEPRYWPIYSFCPASIYKFPLSCPTHMDLSHLVVGGSFHESPFIACRRFSGFPLVPTLPPPGLVAAGSKETSMQIFASSRTFQAPIYLPTTASSGISWSQPSPPEETPGIKIKRSKMQTPLVSSLFTIILMASPSSCGLVNSQMWSGAFKPIGLNTIIRNRCLAEDWRGVVHQRGREEGEEVAELVAEVAGEVTSRALLSLLHRARGHTPLIACSQHELNKMERDFGACVRKVQYQLRCKSTNPNQRCSWVQAFMETCTKEVLGRCLSDQVVGSIVGRQRRYIKKSGLEGRVCTSKRVTSHHNEVLKGPEHPLRISYSDYLKSVLSQLWFEIFQLLLASSQPYSAESIKPRHLLSFLMAVIHCCNNF